MSNWISYAKQRPETTGAYRWRVDSKAHPGLVITFVAHMRERLAGFQRVISPMFDWWDGYQIIVPEGLEWQPVEGESTCDRYEVKDVAIEGVSIVSCPYCHKVPQLDGRTRYAGGGSGATQPQTFNSWSLKCCGWGGSPTYADPRTLLAVRDNVLAQRFQQVPFDKLAYGARFVYELGQKEQFVKIGHNTVAGWDASKAAARWVGQSICLGVDLEEEGIDRQVWMIVEGGVDSGRLHNELRAMTASMEHWQQLAGRLERERNEAGAELKKVERSCNASADTIGSGIRGMRQYIARQHALLTALLPWMERANEKSHEDIHELLLLRDILSEGEYGVASVEAP